MEITISFRPNSDIMSLLEEIKRTKKHPLSDRGSIISRSIELAYSKLSDEGDIEWSSLISTTKFNKTDTPFPDHIRFESDEEKYTTVREHIKNHFKLKKISASLVVRLSLLNMLTELTTLSDTKDAINTISKMVNFGIDTFVFKQEYEMSNENHKEELLSLCREYLEKCDPDLDKRIRETSSKRIREFSDFFNRYRYSPEKSRRLGATYITFSSKVLAGLFIALAEIGESNIDEACDVLQNEIKKRN